MATGGQRKVNCDLVKDGILTLEATNNNPDYTGLVICGDIIVVTERNQPHIKFHRLQDGKLLHATQKLNSVPFAVCLMNEVEICAILHSSEIQFIPVHVAGDTSTMTQIRTVPLKGEFRKCYSAVKFMDKLVVSGSQLDNMLCWCVLSPHDGSVETFQRMCKGKWIYLATKGNIVYTSCYVDDQSPQNGIYAYDMQNPSQKKFEYKSEDLEFPRGIIVDTRGFLFVCNQYWPPSIHHLTDTCELLMIHKYLRGILPDLQDIFWDEKHEHLYLTTYRSNVITRLKPVYDDEDGDYNPSDAIAKDQREQPVIDEISIPIGEEIKDKDQSSEQVPEIPDDNKQDLNIPVEILRMDKKSFHMYKEALRAGKVNIYNIRVMVVGKFGVGKTTLIKRLLGKHVDLNEVKRTEGIDIYKHCCKVSLETGEWLFDQEDIGTLGRLQTLLKFLTDEYMNAIAIREEERHIEVVYQRETQLQVQIQGIDMEYNTPSISELDNAPNSYTISPHAPDPTTNNTDQSYLACDKTGSQESVISESDPMIEFLRLVNVGEVKKSKVEYSTLGIWDFAGQDAFYTTHQTFLTCCAIYILVTDLSQQVTDDKCLCHVQDLVEDWLNLIHCCEPSSLPLIPETNDATSTPATYHSGCTPIRSITSTISGILVPPLSSGTPETSPSNGKSNTSGSPLTSPAAGITTTSSKSDKGEPFSSAVTLLAPSEGVSFVTPPVILVGTHMDKIQQDKREDVASTYFPQIRSILKDKPTLHHLVDFLAIDNTQPDPNLEILKNKIFQLASNQPSWGKEVPTSWVLMEEKLMKLTSTGQKVIPFTLVAKLDQASCIPIQTEYPSITELQTIQGQKVEQLDLFLRYLHEIGTIIYFSEEGLRDRIVLDPEWLIDAQKSLITAESFMLPNMPDILEKWKEFNEKGILTHDLIDSVWTENAKPELHANKDHILLLLERLNIIARPMSFDEEGKMVQKDYFLTPCMLRQKPPNEVISSAQHPLLVSTSVLCFVFTGKFLPPPIFHRLIAACIATWQVAKKRDSSEYLIFCGCCIFDLDPLHRLILRCRNHVIFARITRMAISDVKTRTRELCARVRKFIALNLKKITSYLGQNLPFEVHVQCPTSCGVHEDGMVCWSSLRMWQARKRPDDGATIPQEHINYGRICIAIASVCGKALRAILDKHVPAHHKSINQAILAKKAMLIYDTQVSPGHWRKALLDSDQCKKVFPDPQGQNVVSLENCDVSLLYILIRNISTVKTPEAGWGNPPLDEPKRDTSLGASVERIRIFRNDVTVAHNPTGTITQSDFVNLWSKINDVLFDIEAVLGGEKWSAQLETQRCQVFTTYKAFDM